MRFIPQPRYRAWPASYPDSALRVLPDDINRREWDDRCMSATPAAPGRRSFARSSNDRVLAGVAAGLATRWGVDALAVRAGFVLLSVAGGAGIALYLVALAFAETPAETPTAAATAASTRRSWAVLCFALAALFIFRRAHVWVGDALAWPVALLVAGSLVVWLRRPDSAAEARRITKLVRNPPPLPRIILGLMLSVVGIALLTITTGSSSQIGGVIAAVSAVIIGLVLTAGPWVLKVGRELSDERRERIRVEERAELSAHLHDSVLQTLTLIQRQAGDPDAIVKLARQQEHELRDWLYGRATPGEATVRGEMDAIARDVEARHGVTVDVVHVGDRPLDAATRAMTEATREALVNAAKHAGISTVSLYVENGPDQTTVFVRDRGRGFDPAAVAADRAGIRESIRGRLTRLGGTSEITSTLGEGTEVEMHVPHTKGNA
jgi:signal transduction histidine kinase